MDDQLLDAARQAFLRLLRPRDIRRPDVEDAGAIVGFPAAVGRHEQPVGVDQRRFGVEAFTTPCGIERDRVEQDFQLDSRGEAQHPVDRVTRRAFFERPRDAVLQDEGAQVADILCYPSESLVIVLAHLRSFDKKNGPAGFQPAR